MISNIAHIYYDDYLDSYMWKKNQSWLWFNDIMQVGLNLADTDSSVSV